MFNFGKILNLIKFNRMHELKMARTYNGVILGCFGNEGSLEFTETANNYFNSDKKQVLIDLLNKTKFSPEPKNLRVFHEILSDETLVIIGLGKKNEGYNKVEEIDLKKENIRTAISVGIKQCGEIDMDFLKIDDCDDPKSVGEAASLSTFNYDTLKSKKSKKIEISLISQKESVKVLYEEGMVLGTSQNFSRLMAETPANYMTPMKAAELIQEEFKNIENTQVIIRDKKWIEDNKMGLFLSVAQGSDQPPVLVEIKYKCSSKVDENVDIVLVGKGITFDSGGISIKPSLNMHEMKADMQGGSCVAGSIRAAALLKLPISIVGIIPFTENMPSGSATKPGDVHFSSNGVSVQIDNTDAEGRLVLADGLEYAQKFNPKTIIDMATLTGAIGVALGSIPSAIYSTDEKLIKKMKEAASLSGDRVWQMPLYSRYAEYLKSNVADINNITTVRQAGSCTAAAFLKKFTKIDSWAHLDIAGTMTNSPDEIHYLNKGMSGRPTRTIVEYLKKL